MLGTLRFMKLAVEHHEKVLTDSLNVMTLNGFLFHSNVSNG